MNTALDHRTLTFLGSHPKIPCVAKAMLRLSNAMIEIVESAHKKTILIFRTCWIREKSIEYITCLTNKALVLF